MPDNNGTPTPSYTLTVSGKSAGGTATNEFSASSPLTIEVLVEDTSTNTASVVSGAVVELESDLGVITPANASALTNASGIAEFTLGFNQEEGAGTVTASYVVDGTTYSGTFNVQLIVEPTNEPVITLSLAATNSTGDPVTTLSQGSPVTLTASFVSTLDGVATPINGELVTINTNVGDVNPSNNTALTDANGDAVFTVSFNGTEGAGTVAVTASLNGVDYTDTLNLQAQDIGAPYEISIQIVNDSDVQTNVLSSSQSLTVQALVRRIDGGVFVSVGAGESVQLEATLGRVVGNGIALTNAQGIASFDLIFDGTIGAGVVIASFDSGTEMVSSAATVEAVASAGPTVSIATTVNGVTSTQFDAASDMTVVVTVVGSADYAVAAGDTVSLASTIGTVAGNGSAILVDNAGNLEATFTVTSDGEFGSGTLTVSVDVGGQKFEESVNFTVVSLKLDASIINADSTPKDLGDTLVISSIDPYRENTVTYTLTNSQGQRLSGELIQITTDKGILTPIDGYILTDDQGEATVTLSYSDTITAGAGTLTATHVALGGQVSRENLIQVVGPNEVAENNAAVRVGYLNLPDPLPAGYDTSTIESFLEGRIRLTPSDGVIVNEGSITLEVDVVLTDGVATASVDDRVNTVQKVLIESDCISAGDASVSPVNPVSTSNGVASAVYKAGPGCVGEDQISATLLFGSDKTSEVAIDVVTVSQAGKEKSIRYVTSSVNSLALRGTEGLTDLPEKTLIQFQVVDANGGPLSGEIVELNTTSKLGGLTLTVTDANNISGADYVTDSEGLITVELASGVVATQTRVSAKLTETGEVAFSEVIAISTSIPDDDSVTVAISEYSVAEGLSDVTRGTTLTVRLADRFNNPVPAGYFVYFTTEYGAIPASCEIQIDDVGQSFCQVEWRVGQPLPDTVAAQDLSDVDCPNYVSASVATYDPCPSVLGISEVSRNTVLVTVTGEESFVDNDGDGLFSAGDTLIVEVGEPFLDANYNDAHDPGEEFIDEDGDGLYDSDLDPGFTGIACDPDSGCVADTITLYRNVEFILSAGGEYYIAVVNGGQQLDPSADPVVSGTTYDFYISDRFNNWPASGSSVEITATGECEITSESTFVIPNSPAERAYQNRFRVGGAVNDPDTTDSVKLRITDAAGVTGSVSFACTP